MKRSSFGRFASCLLVTVLVPALVTASIPIAAADPLDKAPVTTPAPKVKVNRTVPSVAPPSLLPAFSAAPTQEELFRARVFEEPLVPLGSGSASENAALAAALTAHLKRRVSDDFSAVEGFLRDFPGSAWRASLLVNLGLAYRRTAFLSKALAAWEEALALSEKAADPHGQAVADRAIGELMDLNLDLGRTDSLRQLFARIEGRDVLGSAAEKVASARQGLWILLHQHHDAVPSGPVALDRIMALGKPDHRPHPKVSAFHATPEGATLSEMKSLADAMGLPMQMAFRERGAEPVLPAMVHFKVGHFAAALKAEGGRILLHDPILADNDSGELWISRAVLEEETSGFVLVRTGALPAGWRAATDAEAAGVRGKCRPPEQEPEEEEAPECKGMAQYSFRPFLASLNIRDTPLSYTPPRGPAVSFTLTYHHREPFQPQTFSYTNVGRKWSINWVPHVVDTPGTPHDGAALHLGSGSRRSFSSFNLSSGLYAPHRRSGSTLGLAASSPVRYELHLPDGSTEVYSQPDGASTFPRRVFLAESIDPQGNKLTFTYDGLMRLVAVTDAVGQVTQLFYQLPSDPLKVTKVTDPFGRSTYLAYDGQGRLQSITDVVGLVSQFTYGAGDFIVAMTTPYGTTTFSKGETNWSEVGDAGSRWLEATDPLGGTERLEYIYLGARAGIPMAEPANLVPAGFSPHNISLQMMNTFYWDQRTMALHPGDYSKATLTHWLRNTDRTKISSTPASEKSPLENRVWYAYPDQGPYDEEGSSPFPTGVARVLDDGTTQLRQFSYTTLGKVTRQVDPVGRETLYEYDENEIDLLRVKQRTATGDVLLAEATYNGQHRPLALTNAARQTTHLTYNSHGQVASIETPARAGITEPRISRYTYTSDGFLETGEDPLAGTTVRFTPDAQGRIRSVAFDGYTFVVDHDDFDRLTRITHPDGTYQEVVYDRLDPVRTRDRLGRWTASTHNARRQLTTFRDPLGRLLTFDWCGCGSLDGVTDGRGQTTRWERDLQGRVVRETRSNGASIEYRHENTTSRLREVIDAKAQTRHYEYYRDDNLKKITYLNTTVPTPSVTFTYDPVYDRLATIQDGLGTSTYGYHPVGDTPVLGAGWLATVDGPLGDDTVSFTYDELSRLVERRVGTGPSSRWHYDLVGRIVGEDGPLGSFQFEYEGVTPRLRRIVYPNGQETQHQFFDNAGGRRLREIRNLGPGGAHLSTFQYEYDAGGNVRRWSRQLGGAAADAFELRYDNADQLVGALLQSAAPQPQALKRYAYSYDPAGNRTAAQADGVATSSAHDAGNRLVRQQSAGAVLLSGVVSEPATLTVAGQPLPVAANNRFEGWTAVAPGANSVSVEARDAAGNQRTYTYGIGVPAESRDLAYDANGNLTSDGERTFEWDGEDRLAAVQEGSRRSEFAYDGRSRLARITEKQGGSVLEERRLIWCGGVRCEERRADGTVVRRFLDHGLQEDGQSYYYTLDHLGSVRELVDEAGTVRARYDYDPFGASQKLSGDRDSVVGFTGHLVHPPSGLLLAPARPYDAQLGRWVQPDPAGFADGLNLYRYVWNNPIKYTDPSGEFAMVPILAMAAMVLGLVLGMPSTANPPGPGDPVYFMPDPPPFLAMGGMIKTTGKLVIMCVTKRAARRAALRAAGIGKNGARQQLPPEPLRPGSQAPTGPPGTRTTVVDPQTGAKVHYDPWGHRLPDGTTIPPHYGVEIPGQPTKHFTWPTTHNPANNR